MTLIDWSIILFVLALGGWGFRQGAVIGISSLVGFLAGTYIGTNLAGKLLENGNESPYTPLFALAVALVVGAIVAELTLTLGFRVRILFTSHVARRIDGAMGAVLLASFALGIVWVGAAAVVQSRGSSNLRRNIKSSAVVKQLNTLLPPTGPLLSALARIDPVPQINGPAANVAAPDPAVAIDPDVVRAAQSTVRLLGTACGYGVEGSGWVAAPGLIVTNAHVIAGQSDTVVQPGGVGPTYPATPLWFDAKNDLAIVGTPGIGAPPLPVIPVSEKGQSAAIIGYPGNGPLDIRPARLGPTQQVISTNIYGSGPITRSMTALRGTVRHGNSGGPVVDADGNVRSVIFAASASGDSRRGYGIPGKVVTAALGQVDATRRVSTGACT